MKTLLKILLFLFIPISFFMVSNSTYALDENLNTGNKKAENSAVDKNKHLDNIQGETDFTISRWGEKWLYYSLVRIARDGKNLVFIIASLYFLILVLKLVFAGESEEEIWKFKKWIIWITIWLVVMQISYSFIVTLYDRWVWEWLAFNFTERIITPLIELLQTWASFLFIAIAIYAFYRIITANGDEEKIKTGKMSVLYAAIWFIIIKFAKTLVDSTYGVINCWWDSRWIFQIIGNNCIDKGNLSGFVQSIVNIINWMNSLVWIIVVIMIIYAGFTVIFSAGDEEKMKKAKMSIVYIAIWLFLLFANYLILTFFILPETTI